MSKRPRNAWREEPWWHWDWPGRPNQSLNQGSGAQGLSDDSPPVAARIVIPKIGEDWIVVQGVNEGDLRDGPGHYPSTPFPGQVGNAAIAGHRTTYGAPFWSLNELREGDRIVLATEYGIFEYRVTRSVVTPPSGILPSGDSVLAQTNHPTLVLTTCNPRFSAAERLIIIADRVGQW